jgi:alkylated DNA nucleotide flippase Atl1
MNEKKTWREKLAESKGLPKIVAIDDKLARRWGRGTMYIPSPKQVDALMKIVPKGKITTIGKIRETLAARHGTTISCPITTGLFAWIAAHAAEEDAAEGKKRITPYWRTLKGDGELNPKYPGGKAQSKKLLEAEGHEIVRRGNRMIVKNFEFKLAKIQIGTRDDCIRRAGPGIRRFGVQKKKSLKSGGTKTG